MIHSSYYRPRIVPVLGDVDSAEIDRAQSIDPTSTLNREKVEEIGRDGAVGYLKGSPTIGYRLAQLEYGSLELWQKLINSAVKGNIGQDEITLNDFKTPYFDILAYLTDDDATFRGTMWYPALRTSGFSINIGDPQARIERSFDFVGESSIIWQGANKYVIFGKYECGSGGDNDIDLTAKAPAEDPDNTGVYMLRVVRVRAGVSTVLVDGTDFSYSNATKILTITSVVASDVIKYWYTSATAPDVIFTPNDADASALLGDCASVYLYVPASGKPSDSDYIYRLQSVNLEVRFDREDQREIGNKNVVQRGIRTKTVTATLGRLMEQFTIEEVLRGEVAGYGKIDIEKFTDQVALIVKVFSDNTKSTFKYGFLATGMTPTEIRGGANVGEYSNGETALEGENLIISADSTILGI
jgi:hypothetical protein